MGVEEVIRDAFTRARDYKRTWDEYRAASAKDKNLIPPRRDLQLEPLVEILEGRRYVHAHCYIASEILMLINLADEFGFKIKTFQHVLEGYKVAKEIAAHGAGASIFADSWGYKIEAYDAIPYNAAIMTRAGVVVSMNSDSDERARRLNIEAAKAMHWGDLTEEQALKLVTLNPGDPTRHSGSCRLDRSRQRRRPRDLEWPSVQRLLARRYDVCRRHGLFRSATGSARPCRARERTRDVGTSRTKQAAGTRTVSAHAGDAGRELTKTTNDRRGGAPMKIAKILLTICVFCVLRSGSTDRESHHATRRDSAARRVCDSQCAHRHRQRR